MGTGIQKWKRIHVRHASHWTLCVRSHGRVSGRNWTEHGWRQALDCKGNSRWNCDLWVHSAPNINTGIKTAQDCCQGVPHHLRCETCQTGKISSRMGNMWDRISAIGETWLRAYHPKLKRQSSEWRHTHRDNASFDKIFFIHEADDHFDIRTARYFYVFPFYRVKCVSAQYDKLFSQYHRRRAVRQLTELFENAIIVHDTATAHSACT